jgi:hypothetical protein
MYILTKKKQYYIHTLTVTLALHALRSRQGSCQIAEIRPRIFF